MLTIGKRDLSWKLPAPPNSPATYDFRNCQLRIKWEESNNVMQALIADDASAVSHGAELVHEVAHVCQDISTGWGFYASELFMALTLAQAGIVVGVIKNTGLLESPLQKAAEQLTGLRLEDICQYEVWKYESLSKLWESFSHGRSTKDQKLASIDVIESHALAYQIIESILAEDREALEQNLNRTLDELNPAFHVTATVIGLKEAADILDFFFILSIHKVFCELALSVGPGAADIQLHPVYATPDDFEQLMPESLSDRFMQIAASAFESLRPVTRLFFGSSNRSREKIDLIIAEVRNYGHWLRGVDIFTGADLEKAWMAAILSPLLSNPNPSASEDPIRAYRSWAMKHWRPFDSSPSHQSQLRHLKELMPPFIIDDGENPWWFIESGGDRPARPHHLDMNQVTSDLNNRLIMSVVPAFFLTEGKVETPCPFFHTCRLRTPVCAADLTSGLIPGCHADQIPAKGLGLKMRKVSGHPFHK